MASLRSMRALCAASSSRLAVPVAARRFSVGASVRAKDEPLTQTNRM
jgi:hypothetical protein